MNRKTQKSFGQLLISKPVCMNHTHCLTIIIKFFYDNHHYLNMIVLWCCRLNQGPWAYIQVFSHTVTSPALTFWGMTVLVHRSGWP